MYSSKKKNEQFNYTLFISTQTAFDKIYTMNLNKTGITSAELYVIKIYICHS